MLANSESMNPSDLAARLGDQVAVLAAQVSVGEHALVTAIAEFDEAGAYAAQGALSTAQWLGYRCGMSAGVAHEKLRVGRALRALPGIDGAWAKGRLTYSKVRALTRVATPDNEAELIEIARSATAAQLERICRHYRAATCEQTPLDSTCERFVRVRQTDRGSTRITLQLPPDEGARFVAALDAAMAQLDRGARGETPEAAGLAFDDERTDAAKRADRADAAMALAESFFASGVRPRRGGAPHEVVLHVDAEALTARAVTDAEVPGAEDLSAEESSAGFVENASDQGISAETARRLMCDASIAALVTGSDAETLHAGRKRRTVPSALRRALDARAQHRCQFPGCTHRYYLDAHHVHHWAHGGETNLDNLVLLCRRHHVFVHEHGWTIESSAEGAPLFIPPNGRPLAASPQLPATNLQALVDAVDEVDARTLEPVGATWEIDYAQIIDVLVHARGERGIASSA